MCEEGRAGMEIVARALPLLVLVPGAVVVVGVKAPEAAALVVSGAADVSFLVFWISRKAGRGYVWSAAGVANLSREGLVKGRA